jgi:hypothetical protein
MTGDVALDDQTCQAKSTRANKTLRNLRCLRATEQPASSQNAAGTILGVVRDAQSAAVAGASVTIHDTETSLARTVTRGDDGGKDQPCER